jgi:MFS family permease
MNTLNTGIPEALQAPVLKVKGSFILFLTLCMLAFEICLNTLMVVVLPMRTEELDPTGKVASMGIVLAIGAILGIFAGPIAGAFSDRTTSRMGRRRPWLLAGGIMGTAALIIMMVGDSIFMLGLGFIVYALFYYATYTVMYSIVPDQVPDSQKGTVSGFASMTAPIGGLIGLVVIASILTSWTSRYLTMAVIMLALVVPFAVFMKDKALPKSHVQPFRLGAFLKNFFNISPKKHPDFFLAWMSRFLVFMGYMLFNTYMLYYLTDSVKIEDPTSAYTTLMILFVMIMTASAIAGGIVSDKLKRRKPLLIISGFLGVAALLTLVLVPSYSGAMAAEAMMGVGIGVYLANSQALAAQVLPAADNRAKDLGLITVANALPSAVGQIFAVPILTSTGSYSTIFLIGAVCAVIGTLLVFRVRTVR